MSILKLDPGTKVTMAVKSAEQVEGKFGPQIKFAGTTFDDPDAAIFLNVDPAFRQLDRIGFSVSSVIGQTVEFERVEKNGTKFTNINRTKNRDGTASAPDAAAYAPTPKPAAPNAKQAYSAGGPLPWEHEETGAAPTDALPHEKLDHQFAVYDLCFSHALALYQSKIGPAVDDGDSAIASIAATLYIQAAKAGV